MQGVMGNMDVQIPIVAILFSLILSRLRTMEAIPLTKESQLDIDLITRQPEQILPTSTTLIKSFQEKNLAAEEDTNLKTVSSITSSIETTNSNFESNKYKTISDLPFSSTFTTEFPDTSSMHENTEELRRVLKTLTPNSYHGESTDTTLSSLKWEKDVVIAILTNDSKSIPSHVDTEVQEAVKSRFILPEEANIPKHVRTKRGTSTVNYCDSRGSRQGNYLRLCGDCHVTTELSSNYYPNVIDEIQCRDPPQQRGCLTGRGKCMERFLGIPMLERLPHHSGVLNILDFSEWRETQYVISVGCECQINKNFDLAVLV